LIALEMAAVLMGGFRITERPPVAAAALAAAEYVQHQRAGQVCSTPSTCYPLQAAAVILLVAIIAAIALTLRERKDSKAIDAADQVRVKPGERVRWSRVKPSAQQAAAPSGCRPRSPSMMITGPFSVLGRDAVCHVGHRYLSEPQEPDRAAHGH
jgi:NADH-quinone oxidoreductase subunit J